MRARSPRMARLYRQRRGLVATMLADAPPCRRCRFQAATEVHELLPRGRGGSITDPSNCVPLCHDCHTAITDHTAPDWRAWILDSDGRGNVA